MCCCDSLRSRRFDGAANACPEGASVRPAKGAALGKGPDTSRSIGPTAQQFALQENGWPVGPARTLASRRVFQGCALRWMNRWAFGPNHSRPSRCSRRGQALVEFAIVSLVVYLLLAAVLTFGQLLYSAQGLQQTVDVAAREISRTPLPAAQIPSSTASITLDHVLYDDVSVSANSYLTPFRKQVFDDNLLVLNIDSSASTTGEVTYNSGHPIGDFPIVTQQLLPLMVFDQVNGQQVLRFPGAVFTSTSGTTQSPAGINYSGYVVRIPIVNTASSGAQTFVAWLYPLEAILDSSQPPTDAFAVNASTQSGLSGVVALRINYPYQSASMSGFVPPTNPASPPGPPANPVVPVPADDTITFPNPPGVGAPVVTSLPGFDYDTNGGAYGLGQQGAFATKVRPYRSVISPQAIYRREVFQ